MQERIEEIKQKREMKTFTFYSSEWVSEWENSSFMLVRLVVWCMLKCFQMQIFCQRLSQLSSQWGNQTTHLRLWTKGFLLFVFTRLMIHHRNGLNTFFSLFLSISAICWTGIFIWKTVGRGFVLFWRNGKKTDNLVCTWTSSWTLITQRVVLFFNLWTLLCFILIRFSFLFNFTRNSTLRCSF